MKSVKYIFVAIVICVIGYIILIKATTSNLKGVSHVTVSTVRRGEFIEFIPQIGIVKQDSIMKTPPILIVDIDELYLPRVEKGQIATSSFDGHDYSLVITNIYPTVTQGRFKVALDFAGKFPNVKTNQSMRLRIELSHPSSQLLLPVGGFYKDTGGVWAFVVGKNKIAVRRVIRLGRRNTECFEVKEGLNGGDRVITSTYQSFEDRDSISLDEVVRLSRGACQL